MLTVSPGFTLTILPGAASAPTASPYGASAMPPVPDPAPRNAEFWSRGDMVGYYAHRRLRPVEAILLDRWRRAFAGRVLELGCGAGRLTRALCERAAEVHAVELSPAMAAACRRVCPSASVLEGDLRDLSPFKDSFFDVVVAPYNVLDVLGDAERRAALQEIRRVIAPGGILVFSAHNRAFTPRVPAALHVLLGDPRNPLASLRRLPERLRNRRTLGPLAHEGELYAIVNDPAHDFAVLHYYITRDAQEEQLAQLGFRLEACFDLQGRPVQAGQAAANCAELHYVAAVRRT